MLKHKTKLLAVLLSVLLVSLSGCDVESTCAEKGGRKVFSHNIITMIMVGKVMVPQIIPQYKCVYQKVH